MDRLARQMMATGQGGGHPCCARRNPPFLEGGGGGGTSDDLPDGGDEDVHPLHCAAVCRLLHVEGLRRRGGEAAGADRRAQGGNRSQGVSGAPGEGGGVGRWTPGFGSIRFGYLGLPLCRGSLVSDTWRLCGICDDLELSTGRVPR